MPGSQDRLLPTNPVKQQIERRIREGWARAIETYERLSRPPDDDVYKILPP